MVIFIKGPKDPEGFLFPDRDRVGQLYTRLDTPVARWQIECWTLWGFRDRAEVEIIWKHARWPIKELLGSITSLHLEIAKHLVLGAKIPKKA